MPGTNPQRIHGRREPAAREEILAALCRRLVLETYAPAAVLINRDFTCLYSMGPTERYLRVPPGHPTHEMLALTPPGIRAKLRAAIQRATRENARVVVPGGATDDPEGTGSFSIAVQPATSEGEPLLLICFLDGSIREPNIVEPMNPREITRVAYLEQELELTQAELQGAIRNLEISSQEQKTLHEEALSVNEEYQMTNEELLASKEELQSLNEELTALNSQLQETLERQRTASNDLQNILYSTDIATLFLDAALNIRFFTPAAKSLFSIIAGDLGRPLADLRWLAADGALLTDARTVLQTKAPIEREIEAESGAWYIRRILPYRAEDNRIEGVVITFNDITERRRAARAVDAAKQQAQLANTAKSRFLAAASHDLRQPLQTFAVILGLLAKTAVGDKARKLVARLEVALGAMSGMLHALLDINQIEAGTIRVEKIAFPISDLLDRLRDELTYQAQAKGLELRVVPCGLSIQSDPRLLEQMIRNLLSNALKFTERGKVLLGCRRRQGRLSIEIWDTGVGIPDNQTQAIFEEYHQLDNAARERSRGLGLGLSIVRRLGSLLGHRLRVDSRLGSGSVFAIEVLLPKTPGVAHPQYYRGRPDAAHAPRRTGAILVIEDDPELREVLELLLKDEGHRAVAAPDGVVALRQVAQGLIRPDLVLADFNLPNGVGGLAVAESVREKIHRKIPVIVLTGDVSTETLRAIAAQDCVQLNKPVKSQELTQAIQGLLAASQAGSVQAAGEPPPAVDESSPVIFVVDDDGQVREGIRALLEEDGRLVEDYASGEAFLEAFHPRRQACLLIDAYLPGMSGLDLLQWLADAGHPLPAVMITGNSDVSMAVRAMKAGASDFIEKPIGRDELLACVNRALEQSRDSSELSARREDAAQRLATLSPRQRQIMNLVLAGQPSKNIAADLGISQRTVENHRATIMEKTGSKSLLALVALVQLALSAVSGEADDSIPHDGSAAAKTH